MAAQNRAIQEHSIAEIGVWCTLTPGIDPSQWAFLCRWIGTRSPREFDEIAGQVKGRMTSDEVSISAPAF